MDDLTRELAEYAASLTFARIPGEIVGLAKQSLVDALGCLCGGRNCEAAEIGRRLIAASGAPARYAGRVIGTRSYAAAEEAAFINSAMTRHLAYGDSWHGGHPSDMLGGLLAVAESAKADGQRLLTAMVVGYEIVLRLIRAAKMGERGFDQGFVIGIGTACALGNLLGLDADRIGHAVGMMAVANVPLRATRSGKLSNWKGAATPFACRNGVYATLLAAEGLTGPDRPFDGRHGLWQQITGPFEIEPLSDKGGPWLVSLIRLKYWPGELHAQAGIWAALELRKRMAVEDIESIDIATYHFAWFEIGSEPEKWDPKTRETADHSLPYTFARALVDGTITIRSYDPEAFGDMSLRPLMKRISIREDPDLEVRYPGEITMRVTAVAKDGRREEIEIVNPRGDGKNRMDARDVDAKFHRLADPVLGWSGRAWRCKRGGRSTRPKASRRRLIFWCSSSKGKRHDST